jgi:hypothetical protein
MKMQGTVKIYFPVYPVISQNLTKEKLYWHEGLVGRASWTVTDEKYTGSDKKNVT